MSQPKNFGPLHELLGGKPENNPAQKMGWHRVVIHHTAGGKAGRWATDVLTCEWTFYTAWHVGFFIEDREQAMLFRMAFLEHVVEKDESAKSI